MEIKLNLEYVFSALVEIGVTCPEKAAAFLIHSDTDIRAIVRGLERGAGGVGEWETKVRFELEEVIRELDR